MFTFIKQVDTEGGCDMKYQTDSLLFVSWAYELSVAYHRSMVVYHSQSSGSVGEQADRWAAKSPTVS